ncbi:hypothetical protein [Infirmifilum sp.]|uniref:hypothetical protein n=1 Tax=Infirmifilum sp. TaxID=2856575 RepID=UPI003D143CED
MKGYNEIRVRLPDHLVTWLNEFAKQTARTSDQLLAYILEHYYQAWKIGYEMGRGITSESISEKITIDIEKVIEDFAKELEKRGYSKKTIKDRRTVARRFLKWCMEKNISIASIEEEHIDLFARELSLSTKTKYWYKNILRDFLRFLQERSREMR